MAAELGSGGASAEPVPADADRQCRGPRGRYLRAVRLGHPKTRAATVVGTGRTQSAGARGARVFVGAHGRPTGSRPQRAAPAATSQPDGPNGAVGSALWRGRTAFAQAPRQNAQCALVGSLGTRAGS